MLSVCVKSFVFIEKNQSNSITVDVLNTSNVKILVNLASNGIIVFPQNLFCNSKYHRSGLYTG